MANFAKLIFTPAGDGNVALAIAASRAGATGVVNFELGAEPVAWQAALARMAHAGASGFALKLPRLEARDAEALLAFVPRGLQWLIVDATGTDLPLLERLRGAGLRVMVERLAAGWPEPALGSCVDAVLLKGNEAGGFVGEDATFILLQKWLGRTELPLYVRGGLTPQVAAACHAVGVAGGAFDAQLLLLDEVRLPEGAQALIAGLSGNETLAVGDGEKGEYFRILSRPGHAVAKAFAADGDGRGHADLRALAAGKINWAEPKQGLLPVGHDVCFAAAWRKRYKHLAALLAAVDKAVESQLKAAAEAPAIVENAPLAQALGIRYPIVQGPMTRVSDSAEFADAVATGGALPMIAFALLKGQALKTLLARTAELLGAKPWGIGLLGFAPQSLLDEQLAAATEFKPSYAIIAGGRPDQAVKLEAAGVPTFLHVPSANLIPLFVQEGARRFIFEGRECGGHIGPLSSFVLWSTMVDKVIDELDAKKVPAQDLQLLFAGGIHDALSSALVQVLIAPLAARGVKVGILMGSAYLFTDEIVSSGAIVPRFQQEVIECDHTVSLESGPGHASRCGYTPFAVEFFRQRNEMREKKVPGEESRRVLDDLIMGRLRIASKGTTRVGENGALTQLDEAQQHADGMYMLGQVATLRDQVTSIERLHTEVSGDAAALLAARQAELAAPAPTVGSGPVDIAIVGLASMLPKAMTTQEYWENILDKVDAITEIPSHRWDWRLYFDADRSAKDKIYSKWGGFLDDLAFDPTKYGMPPKSIESVDPMQLMALEVARRTLVDAGYDSKPFDRERASIIVGASGGTGDVGSQYGLRSELPRFNGTLPDDVADRLPEWTEDSFAGILLNVIAGRIANRLNFGGVNFTTDAACASSLAAVYQGVTELVAGRSDIVIAGGVDTVQGPFGYLCFSKTQALSPTGRCRTFDASGDGIAISEGIAMIALKRLADAERDGDRVYAVIKGVGGSSDGNAKGMTAPLPAGQLRAMRRAYAMAGFGPSTVGLFEAHGTGTVAGDTAELESTTRLIKEEGGAAKSAVIGSVKTMIGHTKATAGVAGMVKAILALHHKVLPPHLNVKSPNKTLRDADAPLYLVDEATPWLKDVKQGVPRRAACSAFGFGGTNFHIVLEEYTREYRPWLKTATRNKWPAELLLWSAADRDTLVSRLGTLQHALAAAPGLALRDLSASLAALWRPGEERLAIVARSTDDLATKLGQTLAYLRGEAKIAPPGVHHRSGAAVGGKVALLFPGQGSQYTGMSRELALLFPVVAETFSEADALLKQPFEDRFGQPLGEFIFPRAAYDDEQKAAARLALTSTDVAQPALGAVEVGLLRLMQQFGLQGDMLAGHSYGEFVAQHAAGAIDFDALMTLSAARGRFIVDAAKAGGAELGTMAAVPALRKDVEDAIADIDGVIIANHNAPLQSIVSGTKAAVHAAMKKLAAAGIEAQEIPVAAAFHSSLVKPAQKALSDLIDATPWATMQVPVYSNGTARPHPADVARSKKLMAEHLVNPVEFVAEVEAMYADGARVFVEVGPKAVLAKLTGRILEGKAHAAIALDDGSGLAGLLGAVGQLLVAGVPLNLAPLFDGRDCRIGDPAQLAALDRSEPLSKTAWMINGSGVRRATDPVQQIGVTLEQAQAAPAPVAAAPAVAVPPAMPAAAPVAAMPMQAVVPTRTAVPLSPPLSRKDRFMDDRRPPPATADAAVMSEYFETMRQFLETQERVMASFMGQAPALPAARPMAVRSRPAPMALPRVAEVAMPVPAPVVAAPAPVVPAPVVAPAPVMAAAPAPVVAKPAPAPVAAAPAPAAKPAAAASAAVSRDKMIEMLLAIVEEKTGYPKDMVGLDQNLESDLGIDSIKRIEVVGAMLQALPEPYRVALTESRSKLNTQPTLNGMLELLTQAQVGGGVAVPFDVAGAGAPVVAAAPAVADVHLSRHVIEPAAQPLDDSAARHLTVGRFVVVPGGGALTGLLTKQLAERGCSVELVAPELLGDEAALVARATELAASPVAGVLHLAALDAPALGADSGVADWRQALQRGDKSLFLLLRTLSAALVDGAHVLAATGLGGLFGRGAAPAALTLQGGAVGMLKSLREERPALRVKAVDTDPAQPREAVAAALLGELELDGGRQEVGYPGGVRTVFRTVVADAKVDAAKPLSPLVVLATGGARGITAEVLREIALPGNTLVLTGRSALPAAEAPETAALASADALRQHFIGLVRSGASKMKPGEINRHVTALLGLREMRANVADFEAGGATVEYHAIDVTDEAAMKSLLEGLYQRHGRIDGVVHGAGVIEDKLLADKASDSWSRVVDTKVLGLLLMQKYLRPESLKFLSVFSSVAGRYGNSGQSDYATANELMNRIGEHLRGRWGGKVNVNALCWGPWGPTKFGAGMVTADTEAKFAAKGVTLVSATVGRKLFRDEIVHAAGAPVEVVCGAGPWERHEAEVGAVREKPPAPEGKSLGPLLGGAAVSARPMGDQVVAFQLDPKHLYLQEHAIDGTPVLPAAAALELLAEAATALWPGWKVVEVREFKLMKGVELKEPTKKLQIVISPPPYGSSEGFEVNASLQTDLGNGRGLTHYRGVVRLEQQLPSGERCRPGVHAEKSLTPARAYGEWLFHGPRFQVIEEISGLSTGGAGTRVRSTHPSQWLKGRAPESAGWVFDPALLDAAAQMAWLWARAFRDESALPAKFGRVVRYRERFPERMHMEYERIATDDPSLVRANVMFFDDAGEPVMLIEELESIASAALNRLGGTARTAVEA